MSLFSQLCVPQEWSQKLEQVNQQLLKQNPTLQNQKHNELITVALKKAVKIAWIV